ncbi:EamA family transporter [Amedibacillus dolichus]|uniref:EamA family transporter n=1 Tax=Amedibacillus dolichus TaxID=31971 RepID=A0ABT7UDI6_9FIRM|nr:EamA family transporter [Amedibacillus dolichus]MDM8157662.1 EamA family transporter [Amedibacillus dolichus]
MLWVAFAFGSAFFAGITAILAKIGIRDVDSTLATALRTVVILLFSWLLVFVVGSQGELRSISSETIAFLVLSGLSTGASWLCYFKALQLGNVNKVTPIDKLSILVTIVFSSLMLKEHLSKKAFIGLVLILVGTGAMLL